MSSRLDSHWKVKTILRYLLGISHFGLLLQPALPNYKLTLRTYCDYDGASDLDGMCSTSGSCIFVGPNLVSWSSKKKPLVTCSPAMTEYRVVA